MSDAETKTKSAEGQIPMALWIMFAFLLIVVAVIRFIVPHPTGYQLIVFKVIMGTMTACGAFLLGGGVQSKSSISSLAFRSVVAICAFVVMYYFAAEEILSRIGE